MRTFFIFLVLGMLFVVGCSSDSDISPDSVYYCEQDSDCVAASCCHASEAVNGAYAPDCSGVLCTAECAPGTLDCGQASIACVKNKCSVIVNG